MKKLFLPLIFALLLPFSVFANAAQPGVWGAGGTGSFSLLFPEDSAAYQKVQMVREQVSVLLFPGYAVVKGRYWMKNTVSDTLSIRAGYPINTQFEGASHYKLQSIWFDSLYGLKAASNGTNVPFEISPYPAEWAYDEPNWYTWEQTFLPDTTTLLEVWFIVNTNNSIVRQGYDKNDQNGFLYLLETGATWKPPIKNGEIRIRLDNKLYLEQVQGVAPDSTFQVDQHTQTLHWTFEDLRPTGKDNVVVVYGAKIENFDFEAVLGNKNALFESIDAFAEEDLSSLNFSYQPLGNPYEVTGMGTLDWVVAIFIGAAVFFFAVFIWVVVMIVKAVKKNRAKSQGN